MITVDRATTTRALEDAWRSLLAVTAELDDDEWSAPTECPGWDVADVVAHVAGTEHMLAGEKVPEVDIGDVSHVRNTIGEFNERWVVSRRGARPRDLWDELEQVVGTRLALLGAMEDREWDAEAWTPAGPDSYGRFMRIRVFDTWMHDQDIRRATGRREVVEGPAFEASLDEMAAAMPYVVAKRGGAPEGSRVELRIDGPAPRVIRVAVEGRGTLVDDFGANEPSVTLGFGAEDYRRVSGGRTGPGDGTVTITGDIALGERILANLAYVI